ncbi:MAG: TonB-dependent receptor, partial [Dechloromonas sp.]
MSATLALLPLTVSADADSTLADVPFDDLVKREVVSASAIARQISDSPSAVAIVTAADIRAYGYRTLADVING